MQQMPALSETDMIPPQPDSFSAPDGAGEVVLGRTLVSLIDEACERYSNPKALNQRVGESWEALSNQDFRRRSENLGLGLLELGAVRGDRVGFFTHSDVSFCLADLACLIAGLVDVPIYLTHPPGAIKHILNETEAELLVCSDADLLKNIVDVLEETQVKKVVLYSAPEAAPDLPEGISLHSFADLEAKGEAVREAEPDKLELLRAQVRADDTATLIYTSGTTGMPKGVVLTHENISSNVIASITGLEGFKQGAGAEVAASFLPLTHIFARSLHYALMWSGSSVYFTDPERLRDDLKDIKPTFFASVPRVLEKAYERIVATGASLTGVKKTLFDWAMDLAKRFNVEEKPSGLYALQLSLADKLVLSKWREALGGNIKRIIVGGAALRGDLVNTFGAAGISIMQGYGLTETSPVITYNRGAYNRPGTVGPPLSGAEVRISAEGEILTRGPHVMKGYYKAPDKTAEVIDEDGWFHTGDLGEFTADGYLKITGRLKNLFKLSTGKYVMPQPLEERLEASPLIDTALVIGENQKYCAALLFINAEALGINKAEDLKGEALKPQLASLLQEANKDMPHWSSVKRIVPILDELSVDNGMLTPKLSVKRKQVLERYKAYVEAAYSDKSTSLAKGAVIDI